MSVEQTRQHWHKGIAIGKLNVVHAEGKEPRLVLDSTVCGVNPKCNIPERVSLPMVSDVRLAFLPEDTRASFIGASFGLGFEVPPCFNPVGIFSRVASSHFEGRG